jgi:hypothetical protein
MRAKAAIGRKPQGRSPAELHCTVSSPGLLAILLVGDVLAAGRGVALVIDLQHRQVGHEAIRRGTVPVLLAGRGGDRAR